MTQKTDISTLETHKTSRLTKGLFEAAIDQMPEASPHPSSREAENQETRRLARSRSSTEVTNRLFNQSSCKTRFVKMLESRVQLQENPIEEQELTHRPQINPISEVLACKRKAASLSIEEHLLDQAAELKMRRERSAAKHSKNELEKCTFKPNLSLITKKLTENRHSSSAIQPIRRYVAPERHSFQPELNSVSLQIMQHKGLFEERSREFQ